MFKETKKRLIAINLSIVMAVVTVSFLTIFILMKTFLYTESINSMENLISNDINASPYFTPMAANYIVIDYKNDDKNISKNNNENTTIKKEDIQNNIGSITNKEFIDVLMQVHEAKYGPTNPISKYKFYKNEGLYKENLESVVITEDSNGKEISAFKPEGDIGTVIAGDKESIADFLDLLITLDGNEIATKDAIYRYKVEANTSDETLYKIVIYNTKDEQRFMNKLRSILFYSGIIIYIFCYFASLFLTSKALVPIKEAWDKQKSFTQDASHELRTPLTVIGTTLEVIKSNENESVKSQEKWLSYISDEVTRMTKLVNDLLVLTKIDNHTYIENKTTVDLSDEIDMVCKSYKEVCKQKGLEFTYIVDEGLITTCDTDKIHQLVHILIDNAIKYNKKDGAIYVSLKRSKRSIVFSVKDTGVGVSKEEKSKIFDRFYRGDASRCEGGNGLGLSLAKNIVKAHKGIIKVVSKGEGSKFVVTIPVQK